MPTAEIIDGKAVYYCFIRVRSLREKRCLEFWKFNLQIEQMLLGSKEINFFSEWGNFFFFLNFLWMEGVVLWIDVRYQRMRTLIPQLGGWRNKRSPQSWGMLLDYPGYFQSSRLSCYWVQAHSACHTAGQWFLETRCWGKECDFGGNAGWLRRSQTNISKWPSCQGLGSRFFIESKREK